MTAVRFRHREALPVQGVPGPRHTVELPSPAYQVILAGSAFAVMLISGSDAVALTVCQRPG
ncbi:hypothetical protein Prum_067560 [Phytohabitans rumicis]|uniref:Uncharacterized protein n=1 Tax=Phytohabitans rumicis TaxID=1076125 RepID=A0A6V8L9V4_9ACTN|nr:hypothetical protein Prum_067560 [Phytohabitans rumicis]